jgi:glucose-6-phosphate 1-epimerase
MTTTTHSQSSLLTDIQSLTNNTTSVSVEESSNKGLCLNVRNRNGRATISLFGGHVLSFINNLDNKERLWLSKRAIFDGKTPIRGGIPICWPWFSAHPSDPSFPSHGYARTQMFSLINVEESLEHDEVLSTRITLTPRSVNEYGYTSIDMKLIISVSSTLTVDIISINQGGDSIPLTQALHTYLLVDDIRHTHLRGLDSLYDDKLSGHKMLSATKLYDISQEVDRIHHFMHNGYSNTEVINVVNDNDIKAGSVRPITTQKISQRGHDSTIVWNPWEEKSMKMKDMPDDGYLTMLCVEAANTTNANEPLILETYQIHKLSQTIY